MKKTRFLWVDDEIELMKPYRLFLEEKGYELESANNGRDAVDLCRNEHFDMIFLDEHMPGISGLETLSQIAMIRPDIPVVMVTKSEDEGIMEKAIGRKIADYLIKPVNPNQLLITIKKHLDKNEIIREANIINFREEYLPLNDEINRCQTAEEWAYVYKKLLHWEIELSQTHSPMHEMLQSQMMEANNEFAKFIRRNYEKWLSGKDERPMLSFDVFPKVVFPLLDKGEKVFFILIDNFRLDQWYVVKDIVSEWFSYIDSTFFSILPTATQYARNAMMAGLTPKQIADNYPEYWVDETKAESKNANEEFLLRKQLERYRRDESFSYYNINTAEEGEHLLRLFPEMARKDLNVLVYNFLDMLSHARSESDVIRELASDEAAYRSLTQSWFLHSPLSPLLRKISENGYKAILTTDHGTIRVKNPLKIVSDKDINANLRYKTGKNLTYDPAKVVEAPFPEKFGLPSANLSSRYIFATGNNFFVYPNNFNPYVSHYGNTFQHGGVSLEEMIVPLITLSPK